ncbi:hypothetical protein Dde_3764 [Oleidesulfovibrio alaskensis G20]|jgi:hypothetical protein|uniref:Uncharacterized protein n=1 Tax=Oleidesulfovibrio alaskensis (strain ATCC BAA-1058 / DSM 17464 / G20) TaxID=207559 RepID=Q30UT9_OLEA2|nr:hypothetical protein [Oleidesulfovibrio alaskensis]ABB40557.1 hypothetical protein Dde_3764 [Oleidesulfovibrio alaskensis G20]
MALGSKGNTAVKKAGTEGNRLKVDLLIEAITQEQEVVKCFRLPNSLLERFQLVKEEVEKQSTQKLTRNAFIRLALKEYLESSNSLQGHKGKGAEKNEPRQIVNLSFLPSLILLYEEKRFHMISLGEPPLSFTDTVIVAMETLLSKIGA